MKQYILRVDLLTSVPEIQLSETRFVEIMEARKILRNALEIEEKYEIILTNYLDFEKQLLNVNADYMIRDLLDYPTSFEIRLSLNIRIINLLTSIRLYHDQVRHNIQGCLPQISDAKEKLREITAAEYDSNREYRFMEALRNHVQHRGLPIHWMRFDRRSKYFEDNTFLEYSIDIASLRSYLEENDKFKKEVLEEMKDEKIDLSFATRSYIESINTIHISVRNMITSSVSSARQMVENLCKQHERKYIDYIKSKAIGNLPNKVTGLKIYEYLDEEQVSVTPILLSWDDIRIQLQNKNGKIDNLRRRYISSTKIPNK